MMKKTDKPTHTRKGIHARRRVTVTSQQPLKPRFSARRFGVLLGVLCLSVGVYVHQNYNEISGFVNRPVTKARMDAQWQQLHESEIRQVLNTTMGKGFFDIDVADVKTRLEQHPWIAQASVKRVWPDSLALQLTEHVAIARWGDGQLLNQYGEIFSPRDITGAAHLPRLQGPQDSQFLVMKHYQQFSQILFPAGLRLTELELSPRGSWQMIVNEDLQVAVGRSDLTEKLERFVEFYANQPKTNAELFATVDLRYGNGIAVKNKTQDLTEVAVW